MPISKRSPKPPLTARVRTPLASALPLWACAVDVLAVRALLAAELLDAALMHTSAVLALSLLAVLALRDRALRVRRGAALGTALLTAFLPVVGVLGAVAVILPAWRRNAARAARPLEHPLPAFSREALADGPPPARIEDALALDAPLEQRIEAVKSLRHMQADRAVPLLRRALSDPAEDVRLLAHAVLERRERAIRAQLERSQAELAHADGEPRRARALVRVATASWELAHAGFVTGDHACEALDAAAHLALDAARSEGHRNAVLLAIDALLARGRRFEAQRALEWAREAGVSRALLLPRAAEHAFLEGRYDDVQRLLGELSPVARRMPELTGAAHFWSSCKAPSAP